MVVALYFLAFAGLWMNSGYKTVRKSSGEIPGTLARAALMGRMLQILYFDRDGKIHNRIVELWDYQSEVLRTREVSTCQYRQIPVSSILCVQWEGPVTKAERPLRYDLQALNALSLAAA